MKRRRRYSIEDLENGKWRKATLVGLLIAAALVISGAYWAWPHAEVILISMDLKTPSERTIQYFQSLEDSGIHGLIVISAHGHTRHIRQQAKQTVLEFRDRAVPFLASALNSSDRKVVHAAASLSHAIEANISTLENSLKKAAKNEDELIRLWSLKALSRLNQSESVREFMDEALRNENSLLVKSQMKSTNRFK